MVGKLVKYEFQATARLYLPLYLVMVVFSVLGRFSLWRLPWQITSEPDFLGGTSFHADVIVGENTFLGQLLGTLAVMILVTYVLVVLGSMVVYFVITLQRFWRNLMGDEGYLMFTLPVTPGQLLWSKAICAFVWGIATFLMVLLSAAILAWHPWVINFAREQWANLSFGGHIWEMIGNVIPPVLRVMLVAYIFIDGIGQLFILYAAMAIGHTVRRHKVLASLGAYGVIVTVIGTAASVLMVAFVPVLTGGVEDIQLFATTEELLRFTRQLGGFLTGVMGIGILLDLAAGVGCFLLARYLLTTQLNLE